MPVSWFVFMFGSESCLVMSDSLQPHGLYSPWNSPGQNTGVGTFSRDLPKPGIEPQSPTLQADSLPTEPQGKPKNTRVGSLSLLQGIFPTQGSNPGFPHCRQTLYHLSHQGKPWILEWVAYPFSRGSSWPRNVSCITRGLFTWWDPGEAPSLKTVWENQNLTI